LAGLAAEAGAGLSPAEELADADRAIAVLARALAERYHKTRMNTDPDPLRARPDFRLLMMDVAMPAVPLAPRH
jgi:hypothetical protein